MGFTMREKTSQYKKFYERIELALKKYDSGLVRNLEDSRAEGTNGDAKDIVYNLIPQKEKILGKKTDIPLSAFVEFLETKYLKPSEENNKKHRGIKFKSKPQEEKDLCQFYSLPGRTRSLRGIHKSKKRY